MPAFPIELTEGQVIVALNGRPRVVSIEPDESILEVYGPEAVYVTSFPTWSNIETLMPVVQTAIQRYEDYQDDF
jgi:hypothetical protein